MLSQALRLFFFMTCLFRTWAIIVCQIFLELFVDFQLLGEKKNSIILSCYLLCFFVHSEQSFSYIDYHPKLESQVYPAISKGICRNVNATE